MGCIWLFVFCHIHLHSQFRLEYVRFGQCRRLTEKNRASLMSNFCWLQSMTNFSFLYIDNLKILSAIMFDNQDIYLENIRQSKV